MEIKTFSKSIRDSYIKLQKHGFMGKQETLYYINDT